MCRVLLNMYSRRICALLFTLALVFARHEAYAQGGGGGGGNSCIPTVCTGGQVITGCAGPGNAFTCGSASSSGVVGNSAAANPVSKYGSSGTTVTPSTIISDDGTTAFMAGPLDIKSNP